MRIYTIFLFLALGASAQAQFLDFSQPARATALGGNLVAMPEGPSAMTFNPAGLGLQDRNEISARYDDLFQGLENDNVSTGNLTALAPVGKWGTLGASWDHLGANQLEQDDIQLGWGQSIPGIFHSLEAGFSLSYLSQHFVLSAPLQGVSLTNVSASSFALGAGLLLSPFSGLTLGVSADDLNEPNLGVLGTDRVPLLLRWGLAAQLFEHEPVRVLLIAAQSLSDDSLDNQGGVELYFADYGIRIRGGLDDYQGSLGFGYSWSDFLVDYAYSFSGFDSKQVAGVGLPNSNLLEVGVKWGSATAQSEYDEYLRKAQIAEIVKNWGWAAWYYQEALAARPNDKTASAGWQRTLPQYRAQQAEKFYNDGQMAEKKTQPADARFYYEMAIKLVPSNPDYAKALQRINDFFATEAIRVPAEKFYQDGLESEKRGALLDARYDLEMATKLVPDKPEYLTVLTRIRAAFLFKNDKASEAEMKIDAIVRQVSDLLTAGQREAALKLVTETLKKYPQQASLELIQKMIPEWNKEGGEAALSNQAVLLLENEADLYVSKGRSDLAKRSLEQALKAQPGNKDVEKKMEELEVSMGDVSPEKQKEAEDLYQKGLQCYLAGDLEGAIQDWEDTLKADPHHAKAQNNLIRAKLEKDARNP